MKAPRRHRSGVPRKARALGFALGLSLSPAAATAAPPADRRAPEREFLETLGRCVEQPHADGRPQLGLVVVLRGEVARLDFGAGRLTLITGGRLLTVRATPGQLAPLTPGQLVELECGDFGGERWLLDRDGEERGLEGFGLGGRARGKLAAIDKPRGVLSVEGRLYRAHPLALEGLLPGQLVALDYVQVDGRRWLRAVSLGGE